MKQLLALVVIIALFASPVLAEEETLFLYSGTDTLNDTENLYETIGTWGDATLTIDYVETGPFDWNPHEAVSPFDNSTIIINDGIFDSYVGAPYGYNSYDIDEDGDVDGATGATLILNGGDFNFRVKGADGILNTTINGGTFGNNFDSGDGTFLSATNLTINDGVFETGTAASGYRIGGSSVTINGGTFASGVRINSGGNLSITAGTFNGKVYFYDGNESAEAEITGGDFTGLEKWGTLKNFLGEVHIKGGDWSNPNSSWSSEYLYTQPVYNFYGQDFEATFLGAIDDELFGMVLSRTYYYQVTGTLCDGSAFNQYGSFENDFQDGQDVGAPIFNFHECAVDPDPIPEPTTVALLGLGALGLVGARRRRQA